MGGRSYQYLVLRGTIVSRFLLGRVPSSLFDYPIRNDTIRCDADDRSMEWRDTEVVREGKGVRRCNMQAINGSLIYSIVL